MFQGNKVADVNLYNGTVDDVVCNQCIMYSLSVDDPEQQHLMVN